MKKILFLLIFAPFLSFGQYKSIKIDNKQIYYEEIFDLPALNQDEIRKQLINHFPSVEGFTDISYSAEIITGKFNQSMIDLSAYGITHWKTAIPFLHPLTSDVNIQWKDGRYKVVLTNLVFHTNLGKIKGNELFLKTNSSEFSTKKIIVNTGLAFEKYLTDAFTIRKNNDNW